MTEEVVREVTEIIEGNGRKQTRNGAGMSIISAVAAAAMSYGALSSKLDTAVEDIREVGSEIRTHIADHARGTFSRK